MKYAVPGYGMRRPYVDYECAKETAQELYNDATNMSEMTNAEIADREADDELLPDALEDLVRRLAYSGEPINDLIGEARKIAELAGWPASPYGEED